MNSKTAKVFEDANISATIAFQRQYAFTLRRTNLKKGVTQGDYLDHFERWHNVKLIDYAFEETAGLHMHGIIEIPVGLCVNQFKQLRIRGWKLHLEELYDELGWKCYYMKDQHQDFEEDDDKMPILTRPLFLTTKHSTTPS